MTTSRAPRALRPFPSEIAKLSGSVDREMHDDDDGGVATKYRVGRVLCPSHHVMPYDLYSITLRTRLFRFGTRYRVEVNFTSWKRPITDAHPPTLLNKGNVETRFSANRVGICHVNHRTEAEFAPN